MFEEVGLNAQRLLSVVSKLVDGDREHRLTETLCRFQNSLMELVSNPTHRDRQNRVAERLDQLQEAISGFYAELTPADMARLEEIRGGRFFAPAIVQVFRRSIAENAITPAVIMDQISRFLEDRDRFLQTLANTERCLKALGIEQQHVDTGSANVGFLLPRALFANRLRLLVAELSTIDRLLRVFCGATGSADDAELHETSTSDPTFSFRVSIPTAIIVAKAAKWALDTWQGLEDIRKVRADAKRINLLTEQELTTTFDDKIQQRIESAIGLQAEEILAANASVSRRRQEQQRNLEWALDSVLTRVDRGMAIEIQFWPSPATRSDAPLKDGQAIAELVRLQSQLVFPRVAYEPARRLPPGEQPHPEDQPPLQPSRVHGSVSAPEDKRRRAPGERPDAEGQPAREPDQDAASGAHGSASEPSHEAQKLSPGERPRSEDHLTLEAEQDKRRRAHGSASGPTHEDHPPGEQPDAADQLALESGQDRASRAPSSAPEPTHEEQGPFPPAELSPSEVDAPFKPIRKKTRKARAPTPQSAGRSSRS
jgi:hypothetical protein